MSYLLFINGSLYLGDKTDDIEFKRYRTKKLDTCDITLINTTKDEAYDVDTPVYIIYEGETTYWLIAQDDFTRTSKEPFGYEHKLNLVENNVQGTTFPNIKFTQPVNGTIGDGVTYSIWDQLERIQNIAELRLENDTTRKWDYDTAIIPHLGVNMETYASTKKAKQVTLNRPNAREAIDKVLQPIGAASKMIDENTIGWEFYNIKNDEIDESDLVVYKGNQNLEQYADKLDMFLENAITDNNLNKQAIVYPSVAWASVRGSEAFLTSDNFIMEVPYPIDTVLKFEVYVNCRVSVISDTVVTFEADITELLSEKSAYNALTYNLAQSVGGFPDTVARNNSVYYEQGGTKIEGFHENLEVFSPFGSYFSYRHLLCYAYWKATGIYATDAEFDNSTNFYDFMFRLTYVPRVKERLRIEKENPLGDRTLFYNQDDRLPDIEKQGNKMSDEVERLGNKQLTIAKYGIDYDDRIKLGDYITRNGEDYIVEEERVVGSKGGIVSEGTLSKFAPIIDRDVSINTENRDTAIDVDNAIVRHELLNEYIDIELVSGNTNDSLVTEAGIERFMEFINNTETPLRDNPVELALFSADISSDILVVSAKSVGTSNVIKFDFGFDTVNIAGRKSTLQDDAWISEYVEYTEDDNARLEGFVFVFFGEYEVTPDTFANKATVARNLPSLNSSLTNTNDEYIDGYSAYKYMIYKDGGEIFKFTYQLTMYSDNDNVIIGDRLATENPLAIKESQEVFLYTSSVPFTKGNFIDNYDNKYEIINSGTPTSTQRLVTFSNDSTQGKLTFNSSELVYWAIGNNNEELYFAINATNTKVVYFKPKKER
jgi:hypothetical protein